MGLGINFKFNAEVPVTSKIPLVTPQNVFIMYKKNVLKRQSMWKDYTLPFNYFLFFAGKILQKST